jgi:hypothetical protein
LSIQILNNNQLLYAILYAAIIATTTANTLYQLACRYSEAAKKNFVIPGKSSGSQYISMIVGNTFTKSTATATTVNHIIIAGYVDAFFTFALIS